MRTHLLSSAPVSDPQAAASVAAVHPPAGTPATRLWQQFTRECRVPPGARLELRTSGSPILITLPLNAPWLIAGTDPTCGLRLHGPDVDPAHYVWFWLAVFAMPFLATLFYSLQASGGQGGFSLDAYGYVLGSFKDNLLLSFETTVAAIVINLLIAVPAAYAIVRYPIPGKSFLLSFLNLSLYTPAAVMGLSLVIAYAYLFRIPQTITGLIAAYVVLFLPLAVAFLLTFALAPMVSALRKRSLPKIPAVILTVALAFMAIGLFSFVVASQVTTVAQNTDRMGEKPMTRNTTIAISEMKWKP